MRWLWILVVCSFFLEAESFAQKERTLNETLRFYLEKGESDGENEAVIAHLYELLGKPAWAALYYRKALQIHPRNKVLQAALTSVEEQLALPKPNRNRSAWITKSECLFLFILIFPIALFSFFFRNIHFFKYLSFCFFCVSLTFLSLALYKQYGLPIEAVSVEPLWLHRSPSGRAPLVRDEPLYPGEVLHVIVQVSGKGWLQITTEDGVVAYVKERGIRLL